MNALQRWEACFNGFVFFLMLLDSCSKRLGYVAWCAAALLAAGGLLPCNSQTHSSATPTPIKIRAKLSGFDLAPTAGHAPNQVGGASRGLGVVLFAPNLGKSYSKTPSFSWSSEDPSFEYTLRLKDNETEQNLLSEDVRGGSFTYPANAPILQLGKTYTWTVEPKMDLLGGPASAQVIIIGALERERVAALLEGNAGSGDPQRKAAKIFTELRLWFDAVSAYNTLITQHPNDAELRWERSEIYASLPQTQQLAETENTKAHP